MKKDFAAFKNNVLKQAKGDYIFLIDPDEILHPNLLLNLKGLLIENPDVDVFAIPRFNHVIGLTTEYAQSQNAWCGGGSGSGVGLEVKSAFSLLFSGEQH